LSLKVQFLESYFACLSRYITPPCLAVFSLRMDSVIINSPSQLLYIAPPSRCAVFSESVDSVIVNSPLSLCIAPPIHCVVFSESVDSVIVNSPLSLCIAPPIHCVVFSESVDSIIVNSPRLYIAPPSSSVNPFFKIMFLMITFFQVQ